MIKNTIAFISFNIIMICLFLIGGAYAQANQSDNWQSNCQENPYQQGCQFENCWNNENCPSPTPKPSHHGCNSDHQCVKKEGKGQDSCESSEDCLPEPSITPIPTATPSGQPQVGTPTDVVFVSQGNPGTPECHVDFDAPKVQGFKINSDGTETYSWWNSTDGGITKLSAVWGYAPGDERFGLDNIDKNTTSLTISGLDLNKTSWFQIWSFKGQCVEKSNWFN